MTDAGGQPDVRLDGRHVLLGVSGGIAAYKAASLVRALAGTGASVQAILTPGAREFVGAATFEGLTGRPVYWDVFEDGHRILHVRLAREADVAVFAPTTANLLAKFAHGLADDLVSSVFCCLTCPVVLAPAMHAEMWRHAATQANVALLTQRGARIVGPVEGELAGGDVGPGRLAPEPDILGAVTDAVASPRGPLGGRRVVVTAAGTREALDPVRFIGNRSSGKMGYALAAEAARRGALVELVSGPTHLTPPAGARLHRVESASQMRDAVLRLASEAAAVLKAAAVADYRPARSSAHKIRKEEADALQITLERTPDILAELGRSRSGRPLPILVGFAAETDLAESRGREKLHNKGLDLIVVNPVNAPDAGFEVDTNRALLLSADGGRTEIGLTTKAALARIVLDRVEALLPGLADPRPPATAARPPSPG